MCGNSQWYLRLMSVRLPASNIAKPLHEGAIQCDMRKRVEAEQDLSSVSERRARPKVEEKHLVNKQCKRMVTTAGFLPLNFRSTCRQYCTLISELSAVLARDGTGWSSTD